MGLLEITIDGVKMDSVVEDSLLIEDIIGQVVNTCEFVVYDHHSAIDIRMMSEVIIYYLDASGNRISEEARAFGGYVAYVVGEPEGFSRYWHVSCQDFTILIDRTLCLASYPPDFTYTSKSGAALVGDRAIIASAFENDALGPSGSSDSSSIDAVTYVDQGLDSLSQQDFKFSSLREVVSQLAQYVGYDFYVDYNKQLHYYYREDLVAPYSLTDGAKSATALNYRNASWKRDGTRIVNTFALFGDRLVSDRQVALLSSVTGQTIYDLTFDTIGVNFPILGAPGQPTVQVDVQTGLRTLTADAHTGVNGQNTLLVSGADFVNDGVGIGDIVLNSTDGSWGEIRGLSSTTIIASLRGGDRNTWNMGDVAQVPIWDPQEVTNNVVTGIGAYDVLHDSLGRILVFRSAPGAGTYQVRLRYAYNFVGGQIDSDHASIARYGLTLSRRVVAADVNSAQGLTQKLIHLKEQYASALEVASVTLDDSHYPVGNPMRLEVGQWTTFTNGVLGVVDKEMLIHRITTRLLGNRVLHDSQGRVLGVGMMLEYEIELRDWEIDLI